MKMTQKDYTALEIAVTDAMSRMPSKAAYQKCNLSPTRYRWDAMWASKFKPPPLSAYLHDDHIDTALRKITGTTASW